MPKSSSMKIGDSRRRPCRAVTSSVPQSPELPIKIAVVSNQTRLIFRLLTWRPVIGPPLALKSFFWSTFFVAAAVIIGQLLLLVTPLPNLSMIFLLAVLLSAVMFGIWPAVYASVLSFLTYNFFFIAPLHTFTIAEPFELFALVIFLAIAIMTSALAGRARDQARVASE